MMRMMVLKKPDGRRRKRRRRSRPQRLTDSRQLLKKRHGSRNYSMIRNALPTRRRSVKKMRKRRLLKRSSDRLRKRNG